MFLILLTFSSILHTYESFRNDEACDWDLYFCEYYNPYPIYYTYQFKCNHHLNCPKNFKCCKHHCFRHKICQPYRKIPAKLLTPFVQRPDVVDKPGVCDVKISCILRFSSSLTRHFECFNDYACPERYKCCYIDCWGHKACQPIKEVTSTTTMTVPVESYMRNTTLEHTSLFPTTISNVTIEYNTTPVTDSIANEYITTTASTMLHEITVEPRVSNMSNVYTHQPNDTINTGSITTSDAETEISINPESKTRYIENSTNSTALIFVTLPNMEVSTSIKPKDYTDNNNITNNADGTNTTAIIEITNDSYQANNTIITISYNTSTSEDLFPIGNVSTTNKIDPNSMENIYTQLPYVIVPDQNISSTKPNNYSELYVVSTIYDTDTSGTENSTNYTSLPYNTVPDQNISSSIKPNNYSELNNVTISTMTPETTNDNTTLLTKFDNSTSIRDVSVIKEDFNDTTYPTLMLDIDTDNITMTTEKVNKTTTVNSNISYNAGDVKTDSIANITTTIMQNYATDNQTETITYEISSTLQNSFSIPAEDKKNITENLIIPINMDYEDINISNSGDGDPEQTVGVDDEDHYINRRDNEENVDKSIWF